ncbi:MAG: hypothetical protein QOH46_3465 [Solirubrobacteraceae bacterium]|jgi:AraC-like DNA-binding protein|nr:hypothetical protein [Solirubrobacteraceae bacterium]
MALLVDTETVAAEHRFDLWAEAHPRVFFPLGVKFLESEPFRGRIVGHRLGPLDLFSIRGDASAVRRTERTIAAFDPERLTLLMVVSGRCSVQQGDSHALIGAGEISSYETSRPFAVGAPDPFELLLCAVPRAVLGARADGAGRHTARRITSASGSGALAGPFLRELWRRLEDGTVGPRNQDLADAALALMRALHAPADERAALGATPAGALVPRIKEYIEHHLADPELGPEHIARAHFISTRYLHKLFARESVTVSEWVRHRRLERCRRDLLDPGMAAESIAAIGARWGLPNHAHFSRVFRETYGCTPRQARGTGSASQFTA